MGLEAPKNLSQSLRATFPGPNVPRPFVKLWGPTSQSWTPWLLLNDQVDIYPTHYRGKNSTVCTRPLGYCDCMIRTEGVKLRGYLGAAHPTTGKKVILLITEGCWDGCPQLKERNGDLRGWKFEMRRRSESATSLVLGRFRLSRHASLRLTAFDTWTTLAKVWGLDRLPEGKQELFRPKGEFP